MEGYPLIGDHGLIGDLQTAALVAADGTVDWLCFPRFDSPSVFASLLDRNRGGRFRIGPQEADGTDSGRSVTRQLYFPDTAILITRFMADSGVGELVDFMPVTGDEATDRHQLVRIVRVLRGSMRFTLACEPRFDYGRAGHELTLDGSTAVFGGPHGLSLTLRGEQPLTSHDGDVSASFLLSARQSTGFLLTTAVNSTSSTAPATTTTNYPAAARKTPTGTSPAGTTPAGSTPVTTPDTDPTTTGPEGAVPPTAVPVGGAPASPHPPGEVPPAPGGDLLGDAHLRQLFTDCGRYWRTWLAQSTYDGRWRDMANRSAITLKLMMYAPTGAPVAAPTTGLPELVGGERNWDYRYTWVRDASFSVQALVMMGFRGEAEAFLAWMADRLRQPDLSSAVTASGPLRIMYRVDGSAQLDEVTLDNLEGYRGSFPVRIGNGASDQLQLDIYGELLDAIYVAAEHGIDVGHDFWASLTLIVDWLADHWDQPEDGIWETRGGRQRFTYGRVMCWVAFDRAIRLARRRGLPANIELWAGARDQAYRWVMERGWSPTVGAFVQHEGSDVLDAALLRMPTCGMVAPRDPRWLSTLRAIDDRLVSDSLVHRYNPEASPDGLRGNEGTFSMCTFWYVDALLQSRDLERAGYALEKMLTYATSVGLFSEEIGLTGEQLGNFPQAFSHLALINTVIRLDSVTAAAPSSPLFGPVVRWSL